MIVRCAWCQSEGQPSVMREIEPFARADVTHGICETHGSILRAEIEERVRRTRRQPEEAAALERLGDELIGLCALRVSLEIAEQQAARLEVGEALRAIRVAIAIIKRKQD
jgi:hypothetical protein